MMAVDTKNNVITHMAAELAHKKDARYLIKTAKATKDRLDKMGISVDTILADAGFSSGENYATLDALNLNSFIPVHGTYKNKRDVFDYDPTEDVYTCQNNHKLEYRQTYERLQHTDDNLAVREIIISTYRIFGSGPERSIARCCALSEENK